jgi:hypothetical protein
MDNEWITPRIDTRVVGLQFCISHSTLMDMSTHKNATRCAIGKDFGIGERVSQASSDTAEVGPKAVDLAVDEKRFRDIVVRDEHASCQREHLATVLVLSESRPADWPKVGGTGKRTKLFVAWVSMCVWRYSVSQAGLGCSVVKDAPLRSQSSPLVTKFGRLPTKRQYIYPNCGKKTAIPNSMKLPGVIQASWASRMRCICLKGRCRGRPTNQCDIQHKTTQAYNATSFTP